MKSGYYDESYVAGRIQKLKDRYAGRNRKMDEWEIAYRMLRPAAEPGYTPVISNLTRTTINMVTSMLGSRDSLRIRVPIIGDTKRSKKLASRKEYWLRGVYRQFDRTLGRKMWEPNLQRILVQHMSLRGWYAVRPLLEEDNPNPFQIEMYDPRQCYPNFGDGLQEFVAEYEDDWGSIYDRLRRYMKECKIERDIKDDRARVVIDDYWCRDDDGKVYNIILVDGMCVKDQHHEEFDEIPILCGPVGGINVRTGIVEAPINYDPTDPWSPGYTDTDYESSIGLSVADGVLFIQQAQSLIMSMLMSNVERWGNAPKVLYTSDGRARRVSFNPNALNYLKGGQFPDKLEELRHNGPPPESLPLIQMLGEMSQRGAAPNSLFGLVDRDLTGFAVNQVLSAAGYLAQPIMDQLKFLYVEMNRMLFKQYSRFYSELNGIWFSDQRSITKISLKPTELLYGLEEDQEELPPPVQGGSYVDAIIGGGNVVDMSDYKISPNEIMGDESFETEVFIEPDLPKDMVQRANIAQILHSGQNGPAVSLEYIHEHILKVEDSAREEELIKRELLERDPEFQMVKMLTIYEDRAKSGDDPESARIAELIKRRLKIEDQKGVTADAMTTLQAIQASMQAMQAMMTQGQSAMMMPPVGGAEGGMPQTGNNQGLSEQGGNPGMMFTGGTPPGEPGINGQVMPPVMTGGVPMGQNPLKNAGLSDEESMLMDEARGAGFFQ